MKIFKLHNSLWLFLIVFCFNTIVAQPPPNRVMVDSVEIFFVGTPEQVDIIKTPLKYNKSFAMSFQEDDSHVDIYNTAYPLFNGNGSTGGLYYTDGCGNSITFKMTSDIYIFNGLNVDLLEPGPYHVPDYLTWPQIIELWKKGYGISNHGVSDPVTGHADYDIQRTQSYAKRKVNDSLYVKVFVQPNQGDAYAVPSKNNNYNGFLGHGMSDALNPDYNGVDLDNPDVDWLSMQKINRIFDGYGYKNKADELYQFSLEGKHRWLPWGWHTNFTPAFSSELTQIYYTYGELGMDNILVASDEEILDYLAVKQSVVVDKKIDDNRVVLTFEGNVPSDRRFYALTLKIKADKYIYDVKVYGTDNYSYSWIFTDSLLLNLSWDGRYYYQMEYLADSFTSLAIQSGNQYDALVAMDYVLLMDCSKTKDSLRNLLCELNYEGWSPSYDEGFCNDISFDLGSDIILPKDDCVTLNGPQNEDEYQYLWSTGDTLSNIEICPDTDTLIWLTVKDKLGFCFTDTVAIKIYDFSFSLGNDTTVCQGVCVDLYGPDTMAVYNWLMNEVTFDTVQNVTVCPDTTTEYVLQVEDSLGFITSDTIVINVFPVPEWSLKPDTTINKGECDIIEGPSGFISYEWYQNGEIISSEQSVEVCPEDTTEYILIVTTEEGCRSFDSIIYNVIIINFDIGNDTSICFGDSITLCGPDSLKEYKWYKNEVTEPFDTNRCVTVIPQQTTDYIFYGKDSLGAYNYDTLIVNINELPLFNLTSRSSCLGELSRVVVQPYNEFVWYIWNYNNIIDSANTGLLLFVPDYTQFVKITVVDTNKCVNNDSTLVTVYMPPELVSPNDTSVCFGETVTLEADGTGFIWWEDSLGNVLSNNNVLEVNVEENAKYVVNDTSIMGCLSSDTVFLTKNDLPNVEIKGGDTIVCKYTDLTLKGEGANNYIWYLKDEEYVSDSILIYVEDTVTIALKGISTEGCINYDTSFVDYKPSPEVSAWGLLPAYCQNDPPDTLYGMPENGIFLGSGIIGDVFNPSIVEPGKNEVVYLFTNEEGCNGYDTMMTKVYSSAEPIDLGHADTLKPADSLVLDAGDGFDSYLWNTGDTTQSIILFYEDYPPGSYNFSVVGFIGECSATGNVEVTFINTQGIINNNATGILVYPNPSSGKLKLIYVGHGNDMSVNIFSSLGVKVYHKSFNGCTGKCEISLNLKTEVKGIYFLEYVQGNKRKVVKLLIR
jgi:hypothetical protein